MRDYFTTLLHDLDKLTGIQQYNKLMQLENWNDEINTLLDILCRTSEQFQFIPDQAKQRIIETAMVKDKDFVGLNARWIYRALEANKDLYFKELAHQETKPEDEPLTGEAREKRLAEFLEAHQRATAVMTQRASSRFDKVREDWKAPEGIKYQQAPPEVGIIEDLKVQYGREHTDRNTGRTLEGHPTFDEWIKTLTTDENSNSFDSRSSQQNH